MFKNKIIQMLPAANSLKRLEIRIEMLHPRYAGLKGTADDLRTTLENTLSPLQEMTGLEMAMVESHMTYYALDNAQRGIVYDGPADELKVVIQEFFKGVVTDEIKSLSALHF